MKHIVRMVVMAVAFASLLSASPMLAQRVTEPEQKPAPVDDDSWYCFMVCWAGPALGCRCDAAMDPTACLEGCKNHMYSQMNGCHALQAEQMEECIDSLHRENDECQASCRRG